MPPPNRSRLWQAPFTLRGYRVLRGSKLKRLLEFGDHSPSEESESDRSANGKVPTSKSKCLRLVAWKVTATSKPKGL